MRWGVLFFLAACGPGYVSEFDPYIDRFMSHANEYQRYDAKWVSVSFGELEAPFVGRCYYRTETVKIKKEFWDAASETTREMLIFHELGHCALKREHVPASAGEPESLMHPSLFGDYWYKKNKQKYLKELFCGPDGSGKTS